jgi:quinolinate synthase
VIAFCGVHFMAETAKILNPTKTVLLPDPDAGCSLEASCPAEDLEAFLKEHADKNYYVVAYVNCSIGVKALADVIVTSGNAAKVVAQAPTDRPILFVPDQNLGSWVMEQLGRPMDLWSGACHVHMEFSARQIMELKDRNPDAALVCHPECTEAVRLLADHICSTEKMITYCRESPKKRFIIVTESGILHRLRQLIPDKEFISTATQQCSCSECRYMKMNTLEKLRDALANMSPTVELPEDLRARAEAPLLRMLELSK